MKNQVLFLVAAASLLFAVSCDQSKKNPGDGQNTSSQIKEVTADVTYSVMGAGDMTVLWAMTAVYTDSLGKETREDITELPWSKTLSKIKIPFDAKITFEYSKNSDYPEKNSYQVGIPSTNISYRIDGGQTFVSSASIATANISKAKVEEFLSKMEESMKKKTVATVVRIK